MSSIAHNKCTPKYVSLRFCKRVQTTCTYVHVCSRPGYTSLSLPPPPLSLSLFLFLSLSLWISLLLSLSLSPSFTHTVCVFEDVLTVYKHIHGDTNSSLHVIISSQLNRLLTQMRDVTTRYMYTHVYIHTHTQPVNRSMAGNSLERSSKWPLFVNRG